MTRETIFTSPLSATAQIGGTTGCQDTVHGRVQSPLATPSSELRSEGAAAKSRSARPPLAVVYGGGESRLMAESHQRESVAEPLTASASRTASDLAAVPLLLTPAEAARHYRVCLRTVRYWIARRRLRVHQPAGKGGKVLIWRDA